MNNRLPRLYPILDTGTLTRRGCDDWTLVARGMLAGGAQILQIRHKGDWTRETFKQAEQIATDCRDANAILVVNDHADMAKLLQAGVHVGQDDLAPTDVRKVLGDQPLVGFSTHNADQVNTAANEPADYLAFGPVFATSSKDNPDPVAGLAQLAHVRSQTTKPLVAIGGITRATAESVFASGADSLAVIGDLLPVTLSESAIRNRMEEWQHLIRK
jgi:thiamine-phosphate pyrophosphorylase